MPVIVAFLRPIKKMPARKLKYKVGSAATKSKHRRHVGLKIRNPAKP